MFNKSKPEPKMPGRPMPPAPLEPPPVPSARLRTIAEKFADEHAHSRVQFLEMVDELAALKDQCDEWRNRALLAEGDTARVERRLADEETRHRAREHELQTVIENLKSDNQRDRDTLQQAMAVIRTQYANASNLILDGFKAMDQLNELYVQIDIRVPKTTIEMQGAGGGGLDEAAIKNIAEKFAAAAKSDDEPQP
jgi:hypothetical protein